MSIVRRLLTLAVLLVLLLSGQKLARAQNAKTLTIGTVQALANLDPADSGDVGNWEILTFLYTGLTRQIPGSVNYELALAASHTVSDDGLTHTFTIRPDAAFDDGTPITAQTFADSINRVLTTSGHGAAVITPYVKSVSVNADKALVITVNQPIPFLEQLLALPPYFPVHPSIFKKDSLNPSPQQVIGNGIYKLEKLGVGTSITLTASPAWKGTPPAAPTIILKHFALPADLREALKAHQVDIAWRGLPPDDVENASRVKGIHAITAPSLQTFYLLIGQNQKPYSDPVVRQGMLYLFDRDSDLHVGTRQLGLSLYTLVPPQLTDSQTPAYPKFNYDQGVSMLDQGGYSKYRRVESEFQTARNMYGDTYSTAADMVNKNISRSDAFSVNRQDTEPQTFLNQIDQGTFRLMLIGWTPVVPHPYAYLQPLLSGVLSAGAHYSNADIDKLMAQAAKTVDPAAQNALYDQAQAIALKDVVAVPLWQAQQVVVAWDSVQGITIEPNFLLRYDKLQ